MRSWLKPVLVLSFFATTALAQTWRVADDGSQVLFETGTGTGFTYEFRNNGVDTDIRIICYDKNGFEVTNTVIAPGNDVNIEVPLDGKCIVSDGKVGASPDADTDGAEGTYS